MASNITSPKAIALWLINETSLTFDQIGQFCDLHIMDVHSIADEIASINLTPKDPISLGYLTQLEIKRCEADASAELKSSKVETAVKRKRRSYTSIAERHNRPRALAWLLNKFPKMDNKDLKTLTGATKVTIEKIKLGKQEHSEDSQPRDPVSLGLCSQTEFDKVTAKYSA